MRIGVLALQGAVIEHLNMLQKAGCEAVAVKKIEDLKSLKGLIIPGGESTTIGKLMVEYGFMDALKSLGAAGFPIFGTCAGLILLATDIAGSHQPRLGLMNMTVQRNAFGRQRESFEVDLEVRELGFRPFRGVFIRAPYIESVSPGVQVLAEYHGKIVMARQGCFLVCAFHPELTDDLRIHKYFIDIVKSAAKPRMGDAGVRSIGGPQKGVAFC